MKPFAVALALLALVFGLAFAFRSGHGSGPPTQAEMEADLICVTCHEPLDESTSPLAMQMKAFIRKKIAAGWTKSEIEDYFVKYLGPQVLAVPRTHGFDLLAWVLPFAGIAVGGVAVGAGAWAWSRNRDESGNVVPAEDGPALGAGLELRVDEALARFDS